MLQEIVRMLKPITYFYLNDDHQGAIYRSTAMISASCAAPPWLVSSISLRAHVRRSARSLWVFSSCLKMFTLFASLVAAGSLFQLFTTLWLKKCPLASVLRLLSLVALVTLSPFSAVILNHSLLSTLIECYRRLTVGYSKLSEYYRRFTK